MDIPRRSSGRAAAPPRPPRGYFVESRRRRGWAIPRRSPGRAAAPPRLRLVAARPRVVRGNRGRPSPRTRGISAGRAAPPKPAEEEATGPFAKISNLFAGRAPSPAPEDEAAGPFSKLSNLFGGRAAAAAPPKPAPAPAAAAAPYERYAVTVEAAPIGLELNETEAESTRVLVAGVQPWGACAGQVEAGDELVGVGNPTSAETTLFFEREADVSRAARDGAPSR